jgi:glycopeptide antibiotics resistance protein
MSQKTRLISALVLVAYSAFVVKLLVFKVELLRIGHLRFRFATEAGEGNFVPFRTILGYLRGEPLSLIALLNLAGNVGLFVPIGFLVALVYRGLRWPMCLALAVGLGLAIEGTQATLRVGIFDIDDVILNSLGIMIGYWAFAVLVRRGRPLAAGAERLA